METETKKPQKGVAKGACPLCKGENLDYDNLEPFGQCVIYNFICNDCGHSDREWYNLKYIGHNID